MPWNSSSLSHWVFIYLAASGLSGSMWDLVPWPGVKLRPPALGVLATQWPAKSSKPLSVSRKLSLREMYVSINSTCAKSLQSCLTLCDHMDCSPPGSSVHGILQAKIPEWFAMPSSRGSSLPGDGTHISCVSCTGRCVLYYWYHVGSSDRCVSYVSFTAVWCVSALESNLLIFTARL